MADRAATMEARGSEGFSQDASDNAEGSRDYVGSAVCEVEVSSGGGGWAGDHWW